MNKFLTIFICWFITACSTVTNMTTAEDVKPWEKDILAQKDMQFPQDGMFAFSDDHIFFSKEASTGGNSVGGGGCGCN
ncbi:hypothetical protein MNBD_DELTA03-1640 [hydrothermal vent metagenome]|uniref:DUF4266 domain-containing protein n=1 Tax=hydrothermal vent metagenome TaxID=652676 RepID=A0A3B0VUW1_9ZZZZ